MPTIHREKGFRFFFYAGEGNEPAHVHCRKQGGEVKIWLKTLEIEFAFDMSPRDQRIACDIVKANHRKFLEEWHEFARKKS